MLDKSDNSNPCGDCHNCCIDTLVRVKPSDIKRWKKEQRYDILICVDHWTNGLTFLAHKKSEKKCVFLNLKTGCDIHETRPDVCRRFPYSDKQKKKYNCLLK